MDAQDKRRGQDRGADDAWLGPCPGHEPGPPRRRCPPGQVDQFFELFAEQIAAGEGPFGPAVSPPERATRLESIVARTGREPSWQAAR